MVYITAKVLFTKLTNIVSYFKSITGNKNNRHSEIHEPTMNEIAKFDVNKL